MLKAIPIRTLSLPLILLLIATTGLASAGVEKLSNVDYTFTLNKQKYYPGNDVVATAKIVNKNDFPINTVPGGSITVTSPSGRILIDYWIFW